MPKSTNLFSSTSKIANVNFEGGTLIRKYSILLRLTSIGVEFSCRRPGPSSKRSDVGYVLASSPGRIMTNSPIRCASRRSMAGPRALRCTSRTTPRRRAGPGFCRGPVRRGIGARILRSPGLSAQRRPAALSPDRRCAHPPDRRGRRLGRQGVAPAAAGEPGRSPSRPIHSTSTAVAMQATPAMMNACR